MSETISQDLSICFLMKKLNGIISREKIEQLNILNGSIFYDLNNFKINKKLIREYYNILLEIFWNQETKKFEWIFSHIFNNLFSKFQFSDLIEGKKFYDLEEEDKQMLITIINLYNNFIIFCELIFYINKINSKFIINFSKFVKLNCSENNHYDILNLLTDFINSR